MPRDHPLATGTTSAMTAALTFAGVGHAYDAKPVLHQVSFEVPAGQILCLLGPSGCGKTTALRLAAGLEQPHSGRILLAGQIIAGAGHLVPPERRGVGLLFQDYALFPHLTVADNIAFGLRPLALPEQDRRIHEWLERVGLLQHRQAYPHMLSGGEQQRIALARALAPKPDVLLLDEPFSNLDTLLRQQVRSEVLQVLKDIGASVLLVTHDAEEALFMGDQIAVMEQGRVLQQGTPAQLYFAPCEPGVAGVLGEVNHLQGRVVQGRIATPFGIVAAPGFGEGASVQLLVRSEGIQVREQPDTAGEPPNASIRAVDWLGQNSLIHLQLPANGEALRLTARVLGKTRLEQGMPVWVAVDPQLVFVFPH
jgi:iron(III) transport system ATP-binding protein